MKIISYDGLFNRYEFITEHESVREIGIYQKDDVLISDVFFGFVHHVDLRQQAMFVDIGVDKVYVKLNNGESRYKKGDGVIVQIVTEKIKGKRSKARCQVKMKQQHIDTVDLNPAHYSHPQRIVIPQKMSNNPTDDHFSLEKFRNKKYQDIMYHRFHLIDEIEKLLIPVHTTKEGATFIIEELETLTAVDVNAADYKSPHLNHSFAFQLASDSFPHILETLMKRRISGTVLIDFVNMPKSETDALENTFKKIVRGLPINIKGFTKTGLLEMSIQKIRRSLWQSAIYSEKISHRIRSEIMVDDIFDQIRYAYHAEGKQKFKLYLPAPMIKTLGDLSLQVSTYFEGLALDLTFEEAQPGNVYEFE